jgi:hypothetical protein
MLLTKKYFRRFQYAVVGACIVSAVLVGSLQSALIVRAFKKNN